MIKKKKYSLTFILSIISIIGIHSVYSINTFILLILFFISFKIILYSFDIKCNKRSLLINFIFSLLFSFCQVIGYNCIKYDSGLLNNFFKTYFKIILLMPITLSATNIILNISLKKIEQQKIKLFELKNSFFMIAIIIFLFQLPVLISFYPGNFSYDAGIQLNSYLSNNITKYHPVIHTLMIGKIITLGYTYFHSYKIGVFIYSMIQMLIMDFIFSYILNYLYKKKVNNMLCILSLLIYTFLPTHTIFSFTTTKDIIFSGLVSIMFLDFIELKENDNKTLLFSLIIFIFLSLIFRNNMIYAFIISLPYIFFIYRKNIKKIGIICLTPLILYIIYNSALTNIFHIKNGPKVEYLSVFIQQLGRTYNKDKLTKKEKKQIEDLFNTNALSKYNSHISDPIKGEFNYYNLEKNPKKNKRLYLELFQKNKLTFIDSFLISNYSFTYLGNKIPNLGTEVYIGITCLDYKKLIRKNYECNKNFEPIYNIYYNLVSKAKYQNVPILNILMNMAVYVWLLFLTICKLIYKKSYKELVGVVILLCLFLTNLFGPVAIVRYIYPFFVSAPLLLYLLLKKEDSIEKK